MQNNENQGTVIYNTTGLQDEIIISPNQKIEVRVVADENSDGVSTGASWALYTRMFPTGLLTTDPEGAFIGNKSLRMNGEICSFAINILSLGTASELTIEYKWISI